MFVIKSRNKRLIMCIMCLVLIFTSVYAGMSRVTCIAQERTQGENSGIELKSQSAILMEASTGQVIYEKDADTSLHPASITKIMTLILIFDAIRMAKSDLMTKLLYRNMRHLWAEVRCFWRQEKSRRLIR